MVRGTCDIDTCGGALVESPGPDSSASPASVTAMATRRTFNLTSGSFITVSRCGMRSWLGHAVDALQSGTGRAIGSLSVCGYSIDGTITIGTVLGRADHRARRRRQVLDDDLR